MNKSRLQQAGFSEFALPDSKLSTVFIGCSQPTIFRVSSEVLQVYFSISTPERKPEGFFETK